MKNRAHAGRISNLLLTGYFVSTIALVLLYFLRNKGYGLDDSYITYRYADNLKKGFGLVFNVGENYYGTTAAGYAVTLAAVSTVLDAAFQAMGIGQKAPHIETVSVFISAVSLGITALCIPVIAQPGKNRLLWIPCITFALYVFIGFAFNEVVGHETYSFLAVTLMGTLVAALGRSPFIAGCVLATAATLRPDAVLLTPIVLGLDWMRTQLPLRKYLLHPALWQYAAGFAAILVPWFIYLTVHFGQPLPGTMDAKKAQVLLGYWPIYNPLAIWKYVTETVGPLAVAVACIGVLSLAWEVVRMRFKREIFGRPEIFVAIAWVGFGIGSVCAYTIFHVTFWRWYGVPVVFSLGIAGLIGWKIIFDQFEIASGNLAMARAPTGLVRYAPVAVIVVMTVGAWRDALSWETTLNDNPHSRAYLGVAEYLKTAEPDGAVIAMFEPGSFGYHLGPKFKVVDELGLISPGVAKALLRGDTDFTIRTYSPKYLVCSWHGSYSICDKPDQMGRFEFIGEFDGDFWASRIGSGARLFRRAGTSGAPVSGAFTAKAISLGDHWGRFERIGQTNEWFVHPGDTKDTVFEVSCKGRCSGYFWAHIAKLPKEAPADTGDVLVTIVDPKGKVLFHGQVNRANPLPRVDVSSDADHLEVSVNNNGSSSYDWLIFGMEMHAPE